MLEIYDSFGKFAIFYISSTVIVVLGIIFNNELCALEDRFDEWIKKLKLRAKDE